MKPIDFAAIYGDGVIYDAETTDYNADESFFLEYAQNCGGAVLELACGTGRLTIPIARAGIDIVGLDVSPAMLEIARNKTEKNGPDIEWIQADARDFDLGRKFKLIIFAFNAIAHIHTREDFSSFASCVQNHLDEDGEFIIVYFNPRLDMLLRDPTVRYPVTEFDDPFGKGYTIVTENNIYNKATQINHIKWYYKTGELQEYSKELNMRVYFPQELDAALEYNGLRIIDKFGDFDKSPFATESPWQVIICK